jgi:hypothetical protein
MRKKKYVHRIIGFDGRRVIKNNFMNLNKLPGFLIPEDYGIIRFTNLVLIKIYLLIDKNKEINSVENQKYRRMSIMSIN